MATGAFDQKTRASSKRGAKAPASPQRWWQWILLYPAFAIALITAGPQWIDKAKSMKLGVRSAAEAERQAQLWAKNASCAGVPAKGFLSPTNVAVDATICDSGDILVRAVTPQNSQVFKWLPLDDVVRTDATGGVIPAAQAATLPAGLAVSRPAAGMPLFAAAMLQVHVICTKSNGRFLLRRLQTPQGCF